MTSTTTPPAMILAGIIRQVDKKHDMGAEALAKAILAHPGSRWGPAVVAPTPVHAIPEISDQLIRSLIGDVLDASTAIAEAACMDRPCNPVPHVRARLIEILRLAALEAWPLELGYEQIFDDGDPEKLPRDAQQIGGKWWRPRFGCDSLANVLEAAKIELDPNGKNGSLILDYLQQVATLPTAWPALPEINDNLIKSLINGVLSINELAIDEYCQGRCCNAVDEFRPRLMEILQLAAQDAP